MIKIKKITWEEILPLWEKLHPNRKHSKYSKMVYDKQIKFNIPENELDINFFGAFIKDKLCGVNSSHLTPNNLYRSRGLYVLPEFRNKGIGQTLLETTIKNVNLNIWSYPRKEALPVYLRSGYIKTTDWEIGGYGTNCYVLKELNYELK